MVVPSRNPLSPHAVPLVLGITLLAVGCQSGKAEGADGPPSSASGALVVSPYSGLISTGNAGGPFSPSSVTFTLQNTESQDLSFTVSVNTGFATLSSTGGTLAPNESTTVVVSLNSNANGLSDGSYSATVTFTNATDGLGSTWRTVALLVGSTPGSFVDHVSQHGITWTFDREYYCGQFVNGDYFVIGPVTITSIDPPSSSSASREMNGSQLNPVPGMYDDLAVQGYDEAMGGGTNYRPALNVGLDISPTKPLVLANGSSLVSTRSKSAAGVYRQLDDAAVLTVLAAAPPDGSFRPPYSGENKAIKFNVSGINYAILETLSLSGISSIPSKSAVESLCAQLKRCWIDHFVHQGDGTQYSSPTNNMPNYGREYSATISEASLLALVSDSELTARFGITRKDILIGLIQIGIDTYEVLKNGGCWPNNGGLNQGRKWPIVFAGALLSDYDMLHVMEFGFTPQNYLGGVNQLTTPFAEDQTIFYLSQYDYDATHVPYWGDQSHSPYIGPDTRDTAIAYTTADLGLPEWGIERMTNPSSDNNWWDPETYRECCTGNGYAGIALVARILEPNASTMTLWNNSAFFDYVDRYMAKLTKGDWHRSMEVFNENMWDRYRGDYGVGYCGLVSNVRQYGDCATCGVVK